MAPDPTAFPGLGPIPPQLIQVPPEGTSNAALMTRPSGAASQSAAEATLGLVTVDILGLAGTAVPPAEPPGLYRQYTWGLNTNWTYRRETLPAGDHFVLVGAYCGATITAADWVLVSTGVVTPMNGTGGTHHTWWWYQFLNLAASQEIDFRVWSPSGGQTIHYDLLRLDGRAQVYSPGTYASGSGGTRFATAQPSGGYWVFDHGIIVGSGVVEMAGRADAGQIIEYAIVNAINESQFASHRNESGPMGWTAPAPIGGGWAVSAIGAALA
jgi:hypothetical protein